MSEQKIDLGRLYQPHPGQAEVHRSTAKAKVLEIARRWGKSKVGLWEGIRRYTESLETEAPMGKVPPFHAWLVAPTFNQSRQAWHEVLAFLPPEVIQPGGVKEHDMMVYLRGNEKRGWGLLEVKSAHDPAALQTAGLDYLWVTEAQDVSNQAYERLVPATRSPGAMGYAVYEGIPALYAEHWFWRLCDLAKEGQEGYYYKRATYQENPFLTPQQLAEIETDKYVLPEAVWRRMYMAERSESAGYFQGIDACTAGDPLPSGLPGIEYVAGLDLGRKQDPSDISIMDSAERRIVARMTWPLGIEWPLLREGVLRWCNQFQVARLVVDATGMGGDIFVSELLELRLPVEPYVITGPSREALLQSLTVAMERRSVTFFKEPTLLRQLRSFQLRKTPYGNYRAEAPPGEHDDAIFSFALALTACREAVPLLPTRRHYAEARYVPTQEEADGGGMRPAWVGRIVEERRKARWDRKRMASPTIVAGE